MEKQKISILPILIAIFGIFGIGISLLCGYEIEINKQGVHIKKQIKK